MSLVVSISLVTFPFSFLFSLHVFISLGTLELTDLTLDAVRNAGSDGFQLISAPCSTSTCLRLFFVLFSIHNFYCPSTLSFISVDSFSHFFLHASDLLVPKVEDSAVFTEVVTPMIPYEEAEECLLIQSFVLSFFASSPVAIHLQYSPRTLCRTERTVQILSFRGHACSPSFRCRTYHVLFVITHASSGIALYLQGTRFLFQHLRMLVVLSDIHLFINTFIIAL